MPKTPKKTGGVQYLLAVETSCDETAAAVLAFPKKNTGGSLAQYRLLSSVVSSQVKLHAKFGGVVPMLAAREQQKNIEPVIEEALQDAGVKLSEMDLFAITYGPGLIPSLHVGVNYLRAIAFAMQKPLLGLGHIEGHIYSNWLEPVGKLPETSYKFPILHLVVSGGHTELVLMKEHGRYQVLGETQDDAAGEAFDKVARMLNLPYPGGPALSKEAEKGNPEAFNFPRPMLGSKDYHFSFSGLKTSVLYKLQEISKNKTEDPRKFKFPASGSLLHDLCASFQQAVTDVLVEKTLRAAKEFKVKGVFLCGGVSANKKLRETLSQRIATELPGVMYRHPLLQFTGDNAAMIAMAAYFKLRTVKPKKFPKVVPDANLRVA